MRTHKTGVVSSNPTRVTIKAPLMRKATGNHLIESTFLEKTQTQKLNQVQELKFLGSTVQSEG